MNDRKNGCLLIWPPFLAAYHLPLGIPFLTAYLKKKGFGGVEIADLNIAYLRKLRLFWALYLFNKKYHSFTGRISRSLKKMGSGRASAKNATKPERMPQDLSGNRRPLWKKIIAYLPRQINRITIDLLDSIKEREESSIPWSLELILNINLGVHAAPFIKKIGPVLRPLIKKERFSLIGISVLYPEQLFFAYLIAYVLKEKFDSAIPVALGGAQVTKHIKQITASKKIYEYVDFLITDDGEEPLAKLLQALPEGHFENVPNLYFRESGGYQKTASHFSLRPDDFPVPDFTGFDLSIYRERLPLLASKGCFWSKCNFCTYASMQEHRYSITTVERTLDVIRELKKRHGISSYKFVDDALPPKFMRRFAEGLIRDKLAIKWSGSIILGREFADRSLCAMLKRSGLNQVSIGLESASSRVLQLMNKCHRDLRIEMIRNILASLKDAGIDIGIHIIFGFPTETIEEARETLNFLLENKNLYNICMFQPFCLEDDTPVFNNSGRFGITRIYGEDKDSGERLGYRYDVDRGMNQKEASEFTYSEALRAFREAGVTAISSRVRSSGKSR